MAKEVLNLDMQISFASLRMVYVKCLRNWTKSTRRPMVMFEIVGENSELSPSFLTLRQMSQGSRQECH